MSNVDIHSLKSVREASIALGEDFVAPKEGVDTELRARRDRRGLSALTSSPLVRKIITFNLLGLMILVAGLLYLQHTYWLSDEAVVARWLKLT